MHGSGLIIRPIELTNNQGRALHTINRFILVNKDGSLRLGPPDGMTNETFRATNRAYLRHQKILVPMAYGSMTLGFITQIIAQFL